MGLRCRGWTASCIGVRGELEDQLGRLARHVELNAVAHAVEFHPVGLGDPVLAEASRRRWPFEQAVGGPPDDPDRARDPLALERPTLALGELDQRPHRLAVGGAADLVRDQVRREVLVALGDHQGGLATTLRRRDDPIGVDRRHPEQLLGGGEIGERVPERIIAGGPAAGRGERDHAPGTSPLGELERQVAAQRVADDMCRLDSRLVHHRLERVGERALVRLPIERGAAGMTGQRRCEHVVPPLKGRQHKLPGAPRIGEPMQADEWCAAATTMRWTEISDHDAQRLMGPRGRGAVRLHQGLSLNSQVFGGRRAK